MQTNRDQLRRLLSEAIHWADIKNLVTEVGNPNAQLTRWQEQVLECLRSLPDAKVNVPRFIRLQRYADNTFVPDLGNFETRTMVVEGIIAESIAFLKDIVEE